MQQKLIDRSCEDFARVLAAKEPVPGGGGAAAYVGALAVALCSMVGNFTTGKKTYAAVEEDIQAMLKKGEEVRTRLLELVDKDAEAFEPLSRAYAIPRDDPRRAEVLEEATKRACAAPLEMMRQVCAAIELLEEMRQKGSRMLLSDVACGALLARAALESAAVNVFVNTKTLTDKDFVRATEAEVGSMLNEYATRAQECAQTVMATIRER
ncbi:MAG: cyclodeaminase/cyclohydrolase family protein [Coriobacteriales bacterium]|nr:cyclodeaminase/cyclohydrolase family protein [Coriobacteriales bacterium]